MSMPAGLSLTRLEGGVHPLLLLCDSLVVGRVSAEVDRPFLDALILSQGFHAAERLLAIVGSIQFSKGKETQIFCV